MMVTREDRVNVAVEMLIEYLEGIGRREYDNDEDKLRYLVEDIENALANFNERDESEDADD